MSLFRDVYHSQIIVSQ